MRYVVASFVCGIGAVIAAFIGFLTDAPAHSPGYGKALPIILPLLSALIFGAVWFPTLLALFLHQRSRSRGTSVRSSPVMAILVVSALAFIPAGYIFGKGAYEEYQRRRLLGLATQATIRLADFAPFFDAYSVETRRGVFSDSPNNKILYTLLRNRATPPEVLQRLADSLDDSCGLWREIASHPNLPKSVIERCMLDSHKASSLAQNPEAAPELLDYLSTFPDEDVKSSVGCNLNTPRYALERLAKEGVKAARKNLDGKLGNSAWRAK